MIYTAKQLVKKNPQFLLQEILRLQGKESEEKKRIHVPLEEAGKSIEASERKRAVRLAELQTKEELRRRMREEVDRQVKTYGLRFIHIRPLDTRSFKPLSTGGITIAYMSLPHSNLIDFSISCCSPKDTFDKVYGAWNAVSAFREETVARIVNYTKHTNGVFLYKMFKEAFTE